MFKYLSLAAVVAAKFTEICPDGDDSLFCQDAERAFGGQIGNTINGMNEYGCWCYFYDDHGRGKGTPVDAIDEMCKTLHEGYECAMRDAEDEGSTCVPWEVDY